MANVLLWLGISLIIVGWLALGWQAYKRIAAKSELERSPVKKKAMQLRRNYCLLTIVGGMCLLIIALII